MFFETFSCTINTHIQKKLMDQILQIHVVQSSHFQLIRSERFVENRTSSLSAEWSVGTNKHLFKLNCLQYYNVSSFEKDCRK